MQIKPLSGACCEKPTILDLLHVRLFPMPLRRNILRDICRDFEALPPAPETKPKAGGKRLRATGT